MNEWSSNHLSQLVIPPKRHGRSCPFGRRLCAARIHDQFDFVGIVDERASRAREPIPVVGLARLIAVHPTEKLASPLLRVGPG